MVARAGSRQIDYSLDAQVDRCLRGDGERAGAAMAVSAAVVTRVNGPVVEVSAGDGLAMLDLVRVGPQQLPGEVIALDGTTATVQVYEYTGGLKPGDPGAEHRRAADRRARPGPARRRVRRRAAPARSAGARIEPGSAAETLSAERTWSFRPGAEAGEPLTAGAVLGTVRETAAIEHRVLVPPDAEGGRWSGSPRRANTAWPRSWRGSAARSWGFRSAGRCAVRGRCSARLPAAEPLVTGQRVLDLLFPVARGCTAAIPGGFGTGKTVVLQQIAKWCDAEVIVYVGCGERGNELADVLAGVRGARGPPHRAVAARPHGADRQHLEHAGDGARGQHLHGRDGRRVLPRHGPRRGRDRRLDLALGGGAARAGLAHRRATRRGGLSGGAVLGARRLLRARRPRPDARRQDRVGEHPRRGLASRRRSDRAGHLAHAAVRALGMVA